MRSYSCMMILGFCLALTACGPDTFYIPIDNKLGNAKPLSKTEDTIRVVIPEKITQYVKAARADGPGWLDDSKLAQYILSSKQDTESSLKVLGYNIINTGLNSGGGGNPNVIALVDSGVLKTYDQTYTWQVPISTDPTTGAPNMWDTKGQTVTMNLIYYKIKIVRPIGKDNPLFTCNSSSLSTNLCVYADNPSNYETIFEGYGTMDTNARSPAYILDHLVSSVLYQYPTLLGKKRVFQESRPAIVITKVTDAPGDKK